MSKRKSSNHWLECQCLIDLDGVLVDFIKGASKHHNKKYPYDDKSAKGRKLQDVFNLENKDFFRGMETQFWEELEWTKDGKKILSIIEEKFGPKQCCICTSPSKNYGSAIGKILWIEKNLANYRDRLIITSKKYFAASPTTILVDDRPKNIELFNQYGGIGILLDRPWNNSEYSGGEIEKLKEDLNAI